MSHLARSPSDPARPSRAQWIDGSPGWFEPFAPLSPAERRERRDACLDLLRRRDGELDFAGRRLSHREAYFDSLDRSALWGGPLEREALAAALSGGPRTLDPRGLWLYAACRANEAESYGVDIEIGRYGRERPQDVPEDQVYLILEEQYHGRILREVCRTCSVPAHLPRPRRGLRLLIHLFEYLPDPMRYVGVICGEVLGCVVFQLLRENASLFAAEPSVAAHLRSLTTEILRDELLHVAYCQARLGRLRLRAAELLLPWIARFLMREIPELAELGCDRAELMRRLRSSLPLPPGLQASADRTARAAASSSRAHGPGPC
jgi:hypothetical protein